MEQHARADLVHAVGKAAIDRHHVVEDAGDGKAFALGIVACLIGKSEL